MFEKEFANNTTCKFNDEIEKLTPDTLWFNTADVEDWAELFYDQAEGLISEEEVEKIIKSSSWRINDSRWNKILSAAHKTILSHD
ncbi:MAG: hypothetical protein LBC39_02705 [Methanobrevibacter sp.]|jgi:hypothetical protein|nr:hypothetical protein [Candidatus Methanovirga aequatorialis]